MEGYPLWLCPLPLQRQPFWHCLRWPPRISTFCGNLTQRDVCRVIWQCPNSPPNRTLAGAGVGRGSAKKPMRMSGGRGQQLVNMLMEIGGNRGRALAAKLGGTSAGRGQSIPSPPVGRPEQRGRQVDTHTKASLPPPITMHLDHQGPPVTYSSNVSRSPRRMVVSSELPVYDVQLKIAAHEKEKKVAQATLDWIQRQEWDEQAALKKQKERELHRVQQHDARCRLVKEGARWQEEYNYEWRASGACPDPITDPLGWCEYEWSKEKNESPVWAGHL